jgi:hypothetical protein
LLAGQVRQQDVEPLLTSSLVSFAQLLLRSIQYGKRPSSLE